jgi:hypothetical protein
MRNARWLFSGTPRLNGLSQNSIHKAHNQSFGDLKYEKINKVAIKRMTENKTLTQSIKKPSKLSIQNDIDSE